MEFRPGVCLAALPITRPSQSGSVQARRGPDSGVGTPLPPHHTEHPQEAASLRNCHQGIHAPPPKRCSRTPPRETALWLSAPKGRFCPVSPLPRRRRQPLHIASALREETARRRSAWNPLWALLMAQVTSGARHPGGRVSLGANVGVRREPGGGPGASVGRKESQETGTGSSQLYSHDVSRHGQSCRGQQGSSTARLDV